MNTSEHINSIKMVVRVAIISVIFFVVECSAAGIAQNTTGTKVLHFPADRSVGKLFVEDEADDWSLIGPAKGDVLVPASRDIKLQIQLVGPRPDDLSFLSKLGASDLHELSIGSSIRRTPANCPALESISHLTGLETLYLSQTGVDSKQLSWLRSLSSLRNLSLFHDYSVGTAGLAVLKDLPALEYFDCYTAPIDAGLEHIGQGPPYLYWVNSPSRHRQISRVSLRILSGFVCAWAGSEGRDLRSLPSFLVWKN